LHDLSRVLSVKFFEILINGSRKKIEEFANSSLFDKDQLRDFSVENQQGDRGRK